MPKAYALTVSFTPVTGAAHLWQNHRSPRSVSSSDHEFRSEALAISLSVFQAELFCLTPANL